MQLWSPLANSDALPRRDLPLRIILVDDDPADRARLAHALNGGGRGEIIAQAATVNEALSEIGRLSPDLVLTETVLPDGHCFDIAMAMLKGMSGRAEERVTLELGPRSEHEIRNALAREVNAERWTSLDRHLQQLADGGRTHHVTFSDLEMTGDAAPGAIVGLRTWDDAKGARRHSLVTRSDLPIEQQISARGATWLDCQNLARTPAATGAGFGQETRDAMAARIDHLAAEGLARRQGQTVTFARDLLDTLAKRDLAEATQSLAARTGLPHQPSASGGNRERRVP